MRAQPLALLGIAALFAAMLGRAGFVDWVTVGSIAAGVAVIVLGALLVFGVLIGAPIASLLALIAFINWATTPRRKQPGATALHLHDNSQPSAPPTR